MNRKRTPKLNTRVTPARWVAFRTLQDFRKGQKFIDEILHDYADSSRLSREDRALSHQLVYGVLRNLYRLDFWIDRMSSKGIGSLPESIVDALRLGLFQLAFLDRIPAHAVVDESVRLCDAISMGPIKGLVNAILRRFPGRRDALEADIERDPRQVAIQTSHPDWLIDWANHLFGKDRAEAWLRHNNTPPRLHLAPITSHFPQAPTPSRSEREAKAIRRLLEAIGEGEAKTDGETVTWEGGLPVAELGVIRSGQAYVQDPAARQAVKLLEPKPGETVYDLCSAPGGKTLQIADLLEAQGKLVSVDSNVNRLKQVSENLSRCGFDWVETVCRDLTRDWEEANQSADAVLVDAPCTGLGTLRRKVDLRYRLKPSDVEELAKKGLSLLENASRLVRPGGRLVFSTCTLTLEENEETVRRFLSKHSKEWNLVREIKSPAWLFSDTEDDQSEVETDGSYCALLSRAN
ncbi:MAG: 16S rRNA (cytosine(967)-C(5))-methyltransferase RsmB [Candidatus Omnitrophica bacterium]|nr:16S rRNA (cytosine(967)-C(5))-methyltransferase RsmB [Candidatus Omnitrophota bacterium]